jgi:hypothetical protein
VELRILRKLETQKGVHEFKKYLDSTPPENCIEFFLECLCEEATFLNANKRYSFQEEIMTLSTLLNMNLTCNQIKIISDLIGNFCHQFRKPVPVPVEKLYAIPIEIIINLVQLLIDGKVYFDTHISVRNDLVFYESVHSLIEYDLYKELVFKTICKTTRCYSDGRHNTPFNPMENIRNSVYLTLEDYKNLCKIIFI